MADLRVRVRNGLQEGVVYSDDNYKASIIFDNNRIVSVDINDIEMPLFGTSLSTLNNEVILSIRDFKIMSLEQFRNMAKDVNEKLDFYRAVRADFLERFPDIDISDRLPEA